MCIFTVATKFRSWSTAKHAFSRVGAHSTLCVTLFNSSNIVELESCCSYVDALVQGQSLKFGKGYGKVVQLFLAFFFLLVFLFIFFFLVIFLLAFLFIF